MPMPTPRPAFAPLERPPELECGFDDLFAVCDVVPVVVLADDNDVVATAMAVAAVCVTITDDVPLEVKASSGVIVIVTEPVGVVETTKTLCVVAGPSRSTILK